MDSTVLVLSDPTERELAMLDALPDTTTIAVGKTPQAFERAAPDADVVLNWCWDKDLLRQVWRMAPRIRWVHLRSAGMDGLLFDQLVESPVPVTNGSGVFSRPLAEFVIGAVLFFAKDFRRMVQNQEAAVWDPFDIQEVAGTTLGIVGYGDIGRAVAARAQALGMTVVALRRRPELSRDDSLVAETFSPARIGDMLACCDWLVVAAPLTAETSGMIGSAQLAVMKPGAVLVNVGRGPVVEEAALVRALETRQIRGAALDVFDEEPLPAGHPFYALKNVLLSPHCADHTPDWLQRAMRLFIENFEHYRKGEPLVNVVDKRAGY
jgi:phosphoglycerate dehydrogenase-like enzyme